METKTEKRCYAAPFVDVEKKLPQISAALKERRERKEESH